MRVSQVVRASADIVRITSLRQGDVYKRVDSNSYTGNKLRYGVVTDVMYDGEEGAVTAVEYEIDFGKVVPRVMCYTTNEGPALFPAQPEELLVHMADLRKALDDTVLQKERELSEARTMRRNAENILTNRLALKAPNTERVGADDTRVMELTAEDDC
jgi:hypothetical protein